MASQTFLFPGLTIMTGKYLKVRTSGCLAHALVYQSSRRGRGLTLWSLVVSPKGSTAD